jgi:hypothetical protein
LLLSVAPKARSYFQPGHRPRIQSSIRRSAESAIQRSIPDILANGRSNTFFSLNGDPLIRAPESSDAIIEKNLQERSEKRRAKARINVY